MQFPRESHVFLWFVPAFLPDEEQVWSKSQKIRSAADLPAYPAVGKGVASALQFSVHLFAQFPDDFRIGRIGRQIDLFAGILFQIVEFVNVGQIPDVLVLFGTDASLGKEPELLPVGGEYRKVGSFAAVNVGTHSTVTVRLPMCACDLSRSRHALLTLR